MRKHYHLSKARRTTSTTCHVRRAGVLSLLLLASACGAQPPELSNAKEALWALQTADSMLQAAIQARDADRVASYYAEDAVLMPVAEAIVEGRAAILAEWRHVFGIPGFANRAQRVAAESSAGGDFGYTRGTYESPMRGPGGEQLLERGKWVSLWKRGADGEWHIIADIFNTDTPPPVHAPSSAERP